VFGSGVTEGSPAFSLVFEWRIWDGALEDGVACLPEKLHEARMEAVTHGSVFGIGDKIGGFVGIFVEVVQLFVGSELEDLALIHALRGQ
jgi:hypothetical protein